MSSRVWRPLVVAASLAAVTTAVHTVLNTRSMRRTASRTDSLTPVPYSDRAPATDTVSVLLPVRNESGVIDACLGALLGEPGVDEVLVFDDGSTDDTRECAERLLNASTNGRLIPSAASPQVPAGWLGKNWACEQLAAVATGSVLVFVDADVVMNRAGIAKTVTQLRSRSMDLLCPYPRQLADGWLPRLVQPLLQWSWLTFVPLKVSESTQRPAMAVANGQLLAVDADSYRSVGGHASVAGEVMEDVELARVFRRAGLRTAVVDGTDIATCRMYNSGTELIEGYTKSLWSAFGAEPSAAAVMAMLLVVYVAPPIGFLVGPDGATRGWGLIGYCSAVAGRAVVARATRQRILPDVLAHPVSVICLATLTAISIRRNRAGTLSWKGRPLG